MLSRRENLYGYRHVHGARRLGRANKPLVVVPKHLTEQWASDFAYLYPGAKVLYMGKTESDSTDAARGFFGARQTGTGMP